MSAPKPALTPQVSKVLNKVVDTVREKIIDNPFDSFYGLRNIDTAGEKRLSWENIWIHVKSNFITDDNKQAYLNNLKIYNDRLNLNEDKKISFVSGMSYIKLINPLRYLYSAVSLVGMGIAKGIDTVIPGVYVKNGNKVEKNIRPSAIVLKALLLAPFALANTIIGAIASVDKFFEPKEAKQASTKNTEILPPLANEYKTQLPLAEVPGKLDNSFNKKTPQSTSLFNNKPKNEAVVNEINEEKHSRKMSGPTNK